MNALSIASLVGLLALVIVAIAARVDSARRGGGRIAQYAPPAGMNLLMAGIFTRSERRAVPAQLVDLAVKKNLRFLAPENPGERVRLEILDGPPVDGDAWLLLQAIAGSENSSDRVRRMLRRDVKLGRSLRAIVTNVATRLRQQGFIGSRRRWLTVLLRWVAGILGLLYLFAVPDGNVDLWTAFGMVALVLVVGFFMTMPPEWRAFHASAYETRDHLAGLHDYITLAEADRLRFLQSPNGALRHIVNGSHGRVSALAINEKLLPYAVLFGHEKEWTRQLEVEYRDLAQSHALDGMDVMNGFSLLGELDGVHGLGDLLGGLDFAHLDLEGIDLGSFDLPDIGIDL